MDLCIELLKEVLSKKELHVVFPDLKESYIKIVELECYKILKEIQSVISNSKLDDKECFMKIEGIISIFEKHNISFGNRHDFG